MEGINLAGLSQSGFGLSQFGGYRRQPQPSRLIERLQSDHMPQRIPRLDFAPGFGQINSIL
jgi:hypothetical protein